MQPQPQQPELNPPILPRHLAWGMQICVLVIAVPLFVCSPVTSDTSLFDVQAMTVQNGGVLYRDIVEPNLPGVVWIHLAIRAIVGWSSEAIRIADLVLFAGTLVLLACVIRTANSCGRPQTSMSFFILCCSLFYLTRNEWCHCQRDVWMMLPVSIAMLLRLRRSGVDRWREFAEGFAWGLAFWIKPHVAIPALLVIIVDCVQRCSWRQGLEQVALIVVGGIAAAAPGITWLITTGAWEHFWEMMLEWNPEYITTGANRRSWERLSLMFLRLYPWCLIHLVAVPLSIMQILNLRIHSSYRVNQKSVSTAVCVLYLGWLSQTFLLQHAMDYIHIPEIVLGIGVLAVYPWRLELIVRRAVVISFLALAMLSAPQFRNGRIHTWSDCIIAGSTPDVRAVLAQGNYPDWQNIERVRRFLENQHVRNGDVTCLNVHSIHLHKELGVQPATRYWSVNCLLTMYPARYDQIMDTVHGSESKFAVVEKREQAQKNQITPEDFPGMRPIVFEAGTYQVYDLRPQYGAMMNAPALNTHRDNDSMSHRL